MNAFRPCPSEKSANPSTPICCHGLTFLGCYADQPVVEFIIQSTTPVLLENAFVSRPVYRPDGLAVGIKPVHNGTPCEPKSNPVTTWHEGEFIPAEIKVGPAVSRTGGQLVQIDQLTGADGFSGLPIAVF